MNLLVEITHKKYVVMQNVSTRKLYYIIRGKIS
jgi:hypothetical protein